MRNRLVNVLAVVAVLTALSGSSALASGPVWNAAGGSALSYAPNLGAWDNQTLRQVFDLSGGGSQIRIRLTQAYSAQSAWVGHVTVGVQLSAAQTVQTPVTATFNGSESVTVPAGGDAVSDPVSLAVVPNTRVEVSIYLPSGAHLSQAPRHDLADDVEYNYVGGDVSAVQNMPITNTFDFNTMVSGIDVYGTAATTVVAVGDSITDGLGTSVSTDTRWPNYLAGRVPGRTVVDQGIGGNRVTADQGASGLSLQNRWARDVLSQPGAVSVIDADGINDLRAGVNASVLEQAQQALVVSAHDHGLRIVLATLTPCAGETQCTPAVQTQLQLYNSWVRAGTAGADGVVDFYAAVNLNGSINPYYDSGDHLHLNSAGARVMADVVDTSEI